MTKRALLLSLAALAPGGAADAAPAPADGRWKEVRGVRIPVPPPEHPRLYLRAADVPGLAARLKHPVMQPVAERLERQAKADPQYRVEWDAVRYLVARDEALGRATVAAALDLLRKAQLPDRSDACRVTGRMMVTGHASEAMILRDMLSAGIAIHDELPERRRKTASWS